MCENYLLLEIYEYCGNISKLYHMLILNHTLIFIYLLIYLCMEIDQNYIICLPKKNI